ncbi:MAG: glycosyltransferase family 4 protein [Fibrobacteria bacterium]|nr:glycosyltransferase family 4 protein [Fibrobacteria bacterium]
MKRILLDGTPLDTSHRHRGVGRYTQSLLAAMQAEADPSVSLGILRLASATDHPGPHLVRPFSGTGRDWLKALSSLSRIETTISRDGAASFLGLDPDVVARPRKARMIATVYDLIPLLHREQYLPWKSQFGLPRLLHSAWNPHRLRQADHIVAISHEVKRTIVETLGIAADRITVIHPGADHLALAPDGPRGRIPSGRPYILHVGAVDSRKNLARTLRALTLLPRDADLQLAVAGRMTTAEEESLREAAESVGAKERLELLGFVEDEQLSSLYRGAVAFAFPSLAEGWGLPVLESMALGCPVVTSDRSSLPEAAGEAAVLVDPTSPEAIADGLRRVAEDTRLRQDLIERGLRRVGSFSWRNSAREHLRLLSA